jgi:hypothetical protein
MNIRSITIVIWSSRQRHAAYLHGEDRMRLWVLAIAMAATVACQVTVAEPSAPGSSACSIFHESTCQAVGMPEQPYFCHEPTHSCVALVPCELSTGQPTAQWSEDNPSINVDPGAICALGWQDGQMFGSYLNNEPPCVSDSECPVGLGCSAVATLRASSLGRRGEPLAGYDIHSV